MAPVCDASRRTRGRDIMPGEMDMLKDLVRASARASTEGKPGNRARSSVSRQGTAADVGLRDWFGRRAPREDPRLREWKREWSAAVVELDPAAARGLRERLNAFGLPEEDVEIEREMLDALEDAAGLSAEIARAGLPMVETGHRVVGRDRCHFTTSASMPDEIGQPAGRLLLTSGRAIFVGGPAAVSSAWHMIGEARHVDRDLVLVRTTRDRLYRFRCNSFSDALCGALIAGELIRKRPA
jgi:hypothetical protein